MVVISSTTAPKKEEVGDEIVVNYLGHELFVVSSGETLADLRPTSVPVRH